MIHIDQNLLLCPICSETFVHIEDVFVSGRPREDGPTFPGHVDSHGRFTSETDYPWLNNGGRRHSFGLGGYCEDCGERFVIEFRQHKGQTVVSVKQQTYQSVR